MIEQRAAGSTRALRRSSRAGDLSERVRDELVALRGKRLGWCAACGRPVFSEQSSTRSRGAVGHVRCPISAPALADRYPTGHGAG